MPIVTAVMQSVDYLAHLYLLLHVTVHRSLGVLTQDLQVPAVMSHRYSNPIETSVTVTLLVFLRVLMYVVRGSFNALICTSRSKTNQGVEPLESRAGPRTSACWLTFRGFPIVNDRSFQCSWWPFAAQANEGWSGDRLHRICQYWI